MAIQPLKLLWSEDLQALQILQLLLLLLIPTFFIFKLTRSAKKPNLPPSPPKLPFIGNLHQVGKLPHRSFKALSQKYGSLMLMQLGSSPTLVVSSAEVLQEITKSQDVAFSSRSKMAAGEKLFYNWNDMAFAPYGEYWRQARKFCVLELLSVKRVHSFKNVREEEVSKMIANINHACQMGKSANLTDLLLILLTNLLSRVAFGVKYQGEENDKGEVWHLMREIIGIFGIFCAREYFPNLGWVDRLSGLDGKINKTFKKMDSFLDRVIEEHLTAEKEGKQSKQEDFVGLLLQAQKGETFDILLSNDNIKGILVDMLVAATDTTTNSVEWTMSELVRHPKVMKKAQ